MATFDRDNNFDGLRLIAATLVVLSHSFHLLGHFGQEPFGRWSGYFSSGHLGVAIFFAMSGYLVTGSWLRVQAVRPFLWHRLLRILPGLAVVVALCAFALGPVMTRLPIGEYFAHPATWAYLKNALLWVHFPLPGVFEELPFGRTVNGSLWTLPVEAAMYLLLMAAGAARLLNRWTAPLLAAVLFLLQVRGLALFGLEQTAPFGVLPLRAAAELGAYFFLGSSLYLFRHRLPWSNYLAGLLLLLWVGTFHTPFGPVFMLLALPYLAIHIGTLSTPYLRRCGRFGDLSYGLYIYSFPIQQSLVHVLGPQQHWATLFFASMSLSLVAACCSWHWVEKRALLLKDRPFALPVGLAALLRGDGARLAMGVLVLIVAVAAVLRFHALGNESLWPDEIYSVMLSRGGDVAAILHGVAADVHPPGYQLLLAAFIAVFGDSEIAVRSLSAVAGLAAVPLLYLLGARSYGRAEGLLAAALLAVSINAVFYSQEARSFALLLLGAVAMGLAFHQAFLAADTQRKRWCAAYVLVTLAALYVHYYALLVLAVQMLVGVVIAWGNRELRLPLGLSWLAIALGFSPWLPALLVQLQIAHWWMPRPTPALLLELFWFVFSDSRALAIAFALAVVIAFAAALKRRRWPDERSAMLLCWLLCWALLPPLAAYLKSLVSTPVFTVRNLIICLPPAYLLIARAFTAGFALPFTLPQRRLQFVCAIAVVGLAVGAQRFASHDFYGKPKRMQYRQVVQEVMARGAGGSDTAIIATDDWFDYYIDKFDGGRRADYRLSTPAEFARVAPALTQRKIRRLWLLQGFTRTGDTPLVAAIEADYRPIYHREFYATRLVLFQRIEDGLSKR